MDCWCLAPSRSSLSKCVFESLAVCSSLWDRTLSMGHLVDVIVLVPKDEASIAELSTPVFAFLPGDGVTGCGRGASVGLIYIKGFVSLACRIWFGYSNYGCGVTEG